MTLRNNFNAAASASAVGLNNLLDSSRGMSSKRKRRVLFSSQQVRKGGVRTALAHHDREIQVQELERRFRTNKYLNAADRESLARGIGLSATQVRDQRSKTHLRLNFLGPLYPGVLVARASAC